MGRPRTSNSHLPKYVTVRGPSYWYAAPGTKAVRVCEVGDYMTLYKFMADKQQPAKESRTIGDLFDRYIREELPKLAEETQRGYLDHLTKLRAWCGNMHPDELTSKDVGRYLRPDGMSKGLITRNRRVAVLSAVYGYAVGLWYVAERNPCLQVKRNKREKRTRYVSDAEFALMCDAAPAAMKVAMDLALLTGQRQGDLLSLKWENVTDAGIYFRQGKTGKRLSVDISPALQAVLDRARMLVPQLPRQYVVHPSRESRNKDGTLKPLRYTGSGFRAIWQRKMRRLVKSDALSERFTFHDIRAKSVSDASTLEDAFERAGHTSMAMTRGVYDRGIRKVKPLR